MKIKNCRLCKGKLRRILNLGMMPLVNYFPNRNEIKKEKKYPLTFCVCQNCGLAQIDYIIPASKLFKQYHYVSGASKPLIEHLLQLAKQCIKTYMLNSKSKVLDIGASDGVFLEPFLKKGIKVLGIEPSSAARICKGKGIDTINDFLTLKLARKIDRKYGKFDLISATHVLANIEDIHDFVAAISLLLSNKGTCVVEVGSLLEMLKKGYYDSIYHEHFSYFSADTLSKLFSLHGLNIVRIEKNVFHGGSMRAFVKHTDSKSSIILSEKIKSSDYNKFVALVQDHKSKMQKIFGEIKGKTVVGIGAPAKSAILLNYNGLGRGQIKYIVDSTTIKQGKFSPGTHIPIYSEDHLVNKEIDYYLILAWNYKDFIFGKLKKAGKKTFVILPFPKPIIQTL